MTTPRGSLRRAAAATMLSLAATTAFLGVAPTAANAAVVGQISLCNYTGSNSASIHGRFQFAGFGGSTTRIIGDGSCWIGRDVPEGTHVAFYAGGQLLAQQYYRPSAGVCWQARVAAGRVAAFGC